jgi:uncharacterized integral membrane protein
MYKVWWLIKWVLKAAIFFTLFAFALNNQQNVTVHFFFGNQWQAPQVLVVLTAFAIGVAVGVMGMVPWWWRQRQKAQPSQVAPVSSDFASVASPTSPPIAGPAYADGI